MPTRHPGQCWECSKRRLVCDLTRPACRKCHARGKECPGYDHKPLKWMQPGQMRSKGARTATRLRLPVRPSGATCAHATALVTVQPTDEGTITVDRRESSYELPTDRAIVVQPPPRDKSTFGLFIQAVEYYNINISPDLLSTGIGGLTNPFFIPPWYASWIPPAIAQTLICAALGHRILQTSQGFEDQCKAMAVTLQSHRGEAIRHLAGELSRCGEETLIAILTLLLCEIQHSISPNWWYHVDGAYTIINMHGGICHSIRTRPLLRHLYRCFIHIDILGSTTTPIVAPHRARRQLELIDCIDGLYGEGMLICVPCPTKLLAEVIHISHFRSLRHEQVAPLSDGTDGHRESSDILPRILSFSPGPWALEVCARVASEAKSVVGGKEPSSPPDTWDWESIGRIYQAAVALYCMASLPDSTDDCDTSLDLRSVLRDSLLQDLKQTSTDPNAQLRKLVLWPLTILGLELDGSDEAAQRFIISEMEWNSATMGIASPLVAKDLLEKVWLSHGGRGTPWESLFDRPYVFGL